MLGTREIQTFPFGTYNMLLLLSTIWNGSKLDPLFHLASNIFPPCKIIALPSPTVLTDGSCKGWTYGSQNNAIIVLNDICPVFPEESVQLWILSLFLFLYAS